MSGRKKLYTVMAAGFLLLFPLGAAVFFLCMQPQFQVAMAAANTVKDSCWAGQLESTKLLKGDGISVYADWNTAALNGDLQVDIGQEETYISFGAGVLGASVNIEGILTEEELFMHIPVAGDMVYTHHLWEETPFFDELLGKRKAESIDKVLQELSGFHWKKTEGIEVKAEELLPLIKKMEIEKTDGAEYDIDGKKVSCRGFVIEASRNPWLLEQGMEFEELYVYIYQGQLAALRVKNGEETWEILFLGGEKRDSKIMFVKNHDFSLTLEGIQEGEEFPVKIAYENQNETRIAFRGNLTENSLEAEIRSVTLGGKDCKLEGNIVIAPGGEIEEFAGETMDLEELHEGQKKILITIFRFLKIS